MRINNAPPAALTDLTLLFGKITMPRLITQSELRGIVLSGTTIRGGKPELAEGVKYDFRFGQQFLKSHFGRPVEYARLSISEQSLAVIEPGEVVFVASEEQLFLDRSTILILSQKRGIAHKGIAVLGGLCVDPGYEGYIIVGLYNFSSKPFIIKPGDKLIAGVFYKLLDDEVGDFERPQAMHDFPEQLVDFVRDYQPVNVSALGLELSKVRDDLAILRSELTNDREWRKDFQRDLEGLLKALKEEKDNREIQYSELKSGIEKAKEKIVEIDKGNAVAANNRDLFVRLAFLIGGALLSLVALWLKGWLKIT